MTNEYFMREALKEAHKALEKDEVPIGAVLTFNGRIVARGHNQVELLQDVTAHAEMLCITGASASFQSKYLSEYALYVTLEPCMMCASAIGWAQIGHLIYGARDEKKGYTLFGRSPLHPKCVVEHGILEEECSRLLKEFFKRKRN